MILTLSNLRESSESSRNSIASLVLPQGSFVFMIAHTVLHDSPAAGLTARMHRVAVREAVREEIMLVHSEGHWDRVRATGCTFFALPFSLPLDVVLNQQRLVSHAS